MIKRRIFVGPVEIAGYYKSLCVGFQVLGVDYEFITYKPHRFSYGGENARPYIIRFASWLDYGSNAVRFAFVRKALALCAESMRMIWMVAAVVRYDVFIFGFGASLLKGNIDLPILKLLRKDVISIVTHGSESRPPYINGFFGRTVDGRTVSVTEMKNETRRIAKRIERIQKYSTFTVGSPVATTQFAKRKLINSRMLGTPYGYEGNMETESVEGEGCNSFLKDCGPERSKQKVHILHAPSKTLGKGTAVISKCIDNLVEKGHRIDFKVVHGETHQKVIEEIRKCDFVVDQLYSDTPMTGFACEAAYFGKPAVVSGYGFAVIEKNTSSDMYPPTKTCHPSEIEAAIEYLILNPRERVRLGQVAKEFVREKWDATSVAKRYLRLISGDVPDSWWMEPKDIVYLQGVGQSESLSKENIRGLVEKYGVESLMLSHRPELEKAFLEFAGVWTKDHATRVCEG